MNCGYSHTCIKCKVEHPASTCNVFNETKFQSGLKNKTPDFSGSRLYAQQKFRFAAPVAPGPQVQHSFQRYSRQPYQYQDSSQVDSLDLVDFDSNKDIWALGETPINVPTLKKLLDIYPNKSDVAFLAEGFEFGFKLHYKGPFYSGECKNLKSVMQNEVLANKKLDQEVALGRMAGPFPFKPISNLRCSPIGLVPKKTGGFRLDSYCVGSLLVEGKF